jgi:2'-5' RNA ligase
LQIYEQLWNEAVAAFERGEPQVDPYLSDKSKDSRRGVTLVFRPSPTVRDAIAGFMGQLATICPEQYFYRPEELHVTVLAVVTGTEHWQHEMGRVKKCRGIVDEALKKHGRFRMAFRGISATPVGVIAQGFPLDSGLVAIRDDIRNAFARNGLGDMLDRRYKISGAHMTIMRFRERRADLKELISFLKQNRQTPFGECEINHIEFYLADWYSSTGTVRMLQEYPLSG